MKLIKCDECGDESPDCNPPVTLIRSINNNSTKHFCCEACFWEWCGINKPVTKSVYDPNLIEPPKDIMDSAEKINNWMIMNGHKEWCIGPVCSRNLNRNECPNKSYIEMLVKENDEELIKILEKSGWKQVIQVGFKNEKGI